MDDQAEVERAPTRWGDREQRRRDILDAARDLIESDGYLALNMRDLASGAGVSPATLYSYFATKEHVFVTLYTERVRRHHDEIKPLVDAGMSLETLFAELLRLQMDTYQKYGQHFTAWSALRAPVDATDAPFPRDLIVDLRNAAIEQSRSTWQAVRLAAERGGRVVVPPPFGPVLLWSMFNGLAEHFASERRYLGRFEPEDFLDFAVGRLVLAMTDAA